MVLFGSRTSARRCNGPRLSVLLLLALASGGCADWLGLSELSFQEGSEPGPEVPREGDGPVLLGAGGSEGQGLGDDEEPADALDDFAATWPEGALAAFESSDPAAGPADPFYWVYDPVEQRLSTYRLRPGDDLVGARDWATDLVWTHVVTVPTHDGPLLIGYDSDSGVLERLTNFSPDGGFDTARSAGNRHSHFLVGTWQEDPVLIGYQQGTGFYRVVPAHPEASTPPLQGNLLEEWGLDCDQLVFARLGPAPDATADGARGVVCYEEDTGTAVFLAFVEPGEEESTGRLELLSQSTWETGLLLASAGAGDGAELIRYSPRTGAVEFSELAAVDGELLATGEPEDYPYRLGLTALFPFLWQGGAPLVTFDGATADIRRTPFDQGPVTVR